MKPTWIVAMLFVAQNALASPLTVLIDPGHGGQDDGAVRGKHQEADIALDVAKLLHEMLRKDRRFRSHLTRQDDRFLSLPERARLANERKPDVFVSIHVNASPDPKARGAEFYFQNQLPPDEESMRLAHKENEIAESGTDELRYPFLASRRYSPEVSSIVSDLLDGDRIVRSSQLTKSLKVHWRGSRKSKTGSVRQAPFYVLSRLPFPSTLVELGFLTHPDDLAALTDPKERRRMAEDLMRGLVAYKESMDKVSVIP